MISFVRGTLSEVLEDRIIVDTGSFGVEIYVPTSVQAALPARSEEVLVYTYFKVSEDAMSLYGFTGRQELDLFKLLIGVNGVGPKAALAVLSVLSPDALCLAVAGEDEKSIARANGVGSKTAKRIIMELKDKMQPFMGSGGLQKGAVLSEAAFGSALAPAVFRETLDALTALGYSVTEAAKALKSIEADAGTNSSKALRLALKKL